MSEFDRYEYVIKPKRGAKNIMGRILLIIGYVFFVVAWLVFGLSTKIFWPLLALIPVSLWILIFITWRYVNVEYEYAIESGIITFSNIYGGKSRKKILIFDVRDAERIIPLSSPDFECAVKDFAPGREFSFVKGGSLDDSFVALCLDEDGNKFAISFTADDRLIRLMNLYNRKAMSGN